MGGQCGCDMDVNENELLQDHSKIQDHSEHDDSQMIPLPIDDPIQLDSYEWEDNKPDPEYARPLTNAEENDFIIKETVLVVLKKHYQLVMKNKVSPNYQLIPKSDAPYLIVETQSIYVGQWATGKPYGIGSIYYPTGDVYEGQVVDIIPDGEGQKVWMDGSHYVGLFKDGAMEGHGRIRRSDRFIYQGMWKKNHPHGKGMEIWPNKTQYHGEYVDGLKCGRGRFSWDMKTKKHEDVSSTNKIIQEQYDGFFKNNVFDGQGQYDWPDGRTYEGEWKLGQMDGYGIFTWMDGRKYEGRYRADSKHGQGIMTWKDGNQLKGTWRLGKLEGLATLESNGRIYKGEWRDGVKQKWIKEIKEAKEEIHNTEQNVGSLNVSNLTDVHLGINEDEGEVQTQTVRAEIQPLEPKINGE